MSHCTWLKVCNVALHFRDCEPISELGEKEDLQPVAEAVAEPVAQGEEEEEINIDF